MNLKELDELGLPAQLIIEASAQSISLTVQKPAPSRLPIVGVKLDEEELEFVKRRTRRVTIPVIGPCKVG